ncbi:MAG: hypothetical protein A2086_03065 [Spirochaetes bacterium GWD1_27_9]|nr:MAG: hypothetical protein A2Z98_13970 [Spirochaetes bacterium GWB1_27_13]OHD26543.1 MAG: hypothetical protein A2Y34_17330 [Spirochaetes bacterium GWC1_27_15]OHD31365.1 MAG: hypothetical protein A2086_03065 [Spirochaetes bacterium GWD1_27_9]
MDINIQKKVRHHYVFQFYLKPWTIDDKLFCLNIKDKKIFNTKTDKIGLKNNFYKLNELSKSDLQFIDLFFFQKMDTKLVEMNKAWIPLFNLIFDIKNKLQEKSSLDIDKINIFEIMINNLLENLHNNIENNAIPIIKELQNDNIRFLEDKKNLSNFLFFLCAQYFRTKKIKDDVINSAKNLGFNVIERIWNVGSIIFSTNLSASLYAEKEQLEFKIIKSKLTNFITGDQPIINVYGNYKKNNKEIPSDLKFYYPISPKNSLLIEKKTKKNFIIEDINDLELNFYNNLIRKASHEQIYSNTKEDLENVKRLYEYGI